MKGNHLFLKVITLFFFLILFSTPSLALIPGDFDGDNVVDFEDLMIFAMAYGSTPGDANWNVLCDIAGQGSTTPDGVVDFEDLMVFAMHYGECECILPLAPTLSDPGDTLPSPATYTVNWTPVKGATSYVLQEDKSPFFIFAQEHTLTDTSRKFSHIVTSTTTYYYRVAAVNSCGQSGWSNVENITVVIVTDPVHNLTKDTYYNTIQSALDDADSLGGDTIEIDDGTYNESIIFPFAKIVTLQSASGVRDNVIIRGANNLSTVTINGSSTDTTLSGFTITHNSGDTGSGISINSSNLIIDNCIISDNSFDVGGGIFNMDGTLTINSSTISGNDVSQWYGGGIYLGGTGAITIGGNDASDTSNFNTFTDNKKDGIISAYQHIRDSSGDCRSSYPYNYYNPN